MNHDNATTRIIPGRKPAADPDAITLSLELPARTEGAATIENSSSAASTSSTQANLEPARVRYMIVGEAGRGGMATVHVARDLELLRKVAIKQLSDELRDASPARLRFLREVQVTAQLDHPYIVPVYGLEVAPGGAPAYAMKLVTGRTLFDYLQETFRSYADGGQPDEEHSLAARIEHVLKICEAIHYAHGKGVIHRDLKPANIMLGEHGETYVMDWGICRLFESDDPDSTSGLGLSDNTGGAQTEFGSVVGTPRYMSPEQAQGRRDELGPLSDQCALGLMLFELVTLKAPFAGNNAQEVMHNAAAGKRQVVSHAFESRAIDPPLRAIIERATRLEPGQRYANVRQLADDLRRYLHGEAVHALPDSAWQRAQRFVGHHRQGMLLSLLGLVALAALGFIVLMLRHEQQAEAVRTRENMERDLIEHVASEGDSLQLQLALVQSELESLALAATQLVQFGVPAENPSIYWSEDFLDAEKRPADYAIQPGTGHEFSMQEAVWSVAPGLDKSTLRPDVARLDHLRSYRDTLLETTRRSLGGGQYANGILGLELVLEKGLFMRYPGRIVLDERDPRESDAYRTMKAEAKSLWGTPFADEDGDNVLLPLSSPMRAPDGMFIGALSMEIALDFIVYNLLRDDDGHKLILLDGDARLLASEDVLKPAANGQPAGLLTPFGDDALRETFRNNEVGTVSTQFLGRADIIAFDHIDPLGWILVLVAEDPDGN
ncbi:serine/threonine protein kinase [Dokdonella sp.]|uniref:serine/threonine protein kinase n=1 Tax=Dokdonella sp. TaxID=2291710 RepID=UPI0035291B4D